MGNFMVVVVCTGMNDLRAKTLGQYWTLKVAFKLNRVGSQPTECGLVYLLSGAQLSRGLEFWFATSTAIETFKMFHRTRRFKLYSQKPIACPYRVKSIHSHFISVRSSLISLSYLLTQFNQIAPTLKFF
jgi:hypothetical protein